MSDENKQFFFGIVGLVFALWGLLIMVQMAVNTLALYGRIIFYPTPTLVLCIIITVIASSLSHGYDKQETDSDE